MIPPNESRRSKLTMSRLTPPLSDCPTYITLFFVHVLSQVTKVCVAAVAQKEEEALQRWKEENRPPPVHLNPERLGKPTRLYYRKYPTQITNNLCDVILTLLCTCFICQGGNETLTAAREKQLTELRFSKLQKKVITPFLQQPHIVFIHSYLSSVILMWSVNVTSLTMR